MLGEGSPLGRASKDTILFIPLSAAQYNLEQDWAEAGESIPRHCPDCLLDSIVGHGRRRKQAHDENHDWIAIRRGLCKLCRLTFTFLPPFSLPYTHYSLIARSESAQRRFQQNSSLENAAPAVKDAARVADPSTLRRWFRSLDNSNPPFSFLRRAIGDVSQWLAHGRIVQHGSLRLSWPTVVPFLQVLWPLRL